MSHDIDTLVFDAAPCGLLAVDAETGAVARANRRARSLLGFEEGEVEGAQAAALFENASRGAIEALVSSGDRTAGPAIVVPVRSPSSDVVVSASVAEAAGRKIVVLSLVPLAEASQGPSFSSYSTRRSALAALRAAVSRAAGQAWLLFVDVDRFRSVIAQVGHVEAEAVLDAIGERLQEAVGSDGTLVRFGGDEFVALAFLAKGAKEAEAVAQRIVEAADAPDGVGARHTRVTVSVGVAAVESGPAGLETAIKRAEAAARAAKAAGRARFRVYDPILASQEEASEDIAEGLRRALERGELVLHYQPVIDVRDRFVAGAEALVRWERPGHGLVMPGDFIPVAEQTGLVSDLGEWVIHEACRQMREWQGAGLDRLWVSVNVSARQLRSGEVVEHVREATKDAGVDLSRCVLEVTETALVEDSETAAEVLQALRAMGARIALDDFGTGYSSLSRMREMPFNELKIDRSFLQRIDARAQDAALVAAMVALAHSFDSRAIAEGVETDDQLSYLKALKCDMAQGYVFSRPVPPDVFKQFVAAGPSWLGA